jgi:hypothetical protein
MPRKNQPGCPCCGSVQCCNWFCSGLVDVPEYVDVTDPVYGTFRLPRVQSGSACGYALDTYLSFEGKGSCPAGMIPVHMVLSESSSFGLAFVIYFNDNGTTGACGPPQGPPETNCETDGDGICSPPSTLWIPCPTNNLTFPVVFPAPLCQCEGQCHVVIPITCNGTNPFSFSGQNTPIPVLCGATIFTNPVYLVYGSCPTHSAGTGGFYQGTWTFQGGPTDPIGCKACCFGGLMCQTVCVTDGCLRSGPVGDPVTISNGSGTVASGVIGPNGCAYLTWQGQPETYTVTVIDDGDTQSVTQNLNCTTSINFEFPGGIERCVGDTENLTCSFAWSINGGQFTGTVVFPLVYSAFGSAWFGQGFFFGGLLVNIIVNAANGNCTVQYDLCGLSTEYFSLISVFTCDPFMFVGTIPSQNYCGTGTFVGGTVTITP